jgi:hypothetical protein
VRRLGVQAVTDVRRVLAFGDKVYVLASISYSPPAGPRDQHEGFLARVWMQWDEGSSARTYAAARRSLGGFLSVR